MVTQHRENWKSRKRDRKKLGQRETIGNESAAT